MRRTPLRLTVVRFPKRRALADAVAIVVFATIGQLSHEGHVSAHGYARDALTLLAGWFIAFAVFRGRLVPTWLAGVVLGVAIRMVVLGHYHWNQIAFFTTTLVIVGALAALSRAVARAAVRR
ncbi:MAG: DUF3054 domain-containing protein [Gaiellaceae bacterium]